AIEASGTWWWLVDLLERLGHAPILSNPKQTKAIAAARLKNDRVDAQRLALPLPGPAAPRVDPLPGLARSARSRWSSHPARVAPRGDSQSAPGHAGPAQPPSDVR